MKKSPWLMALSFAVMANAHAATVTVSAAASLKDAFTDIAAQYQVSHPDTTIEFNFGASGALAQQIIQGAPVDLFASADELRMQQLADKNLLVDNSREDFAQNSVVLIVPKNSALNIANLDSLKQVVFKKIALGNVRSVPVGSYTENGLKQAKLWDALYPKMVFAENVRQVLDYVARGEVDAGFVYATDAAIKKDGVKIVQTLPLSTKVSYPLAVIKGSSNQQAAIDFSHYILSTKAQMILLKYGFSPANK